MPEPSRGTPISFQLLRTELDEGQNSTLILSLPLVGGSSGTAFNQQYNFLINIPIEFLPVSNGF